MARIKIIAEESIPYLKGVLEELGKVTYLPNSQFSNERIKGAEWLIVRSITKCNEELLSGSDVRLITTATIGFDHIDRDYCSRAGITWFNAPGCNAQSVGLYIASALSRYKLEHPGVDFRNIVLGIVGAGNVGKAVQWYAETLGMRVLLNDPPRAEEEGPDGFVSLAQIAKESDVISFHTPITSEGRHPTYHLCDWDFISRLAKKPILINSCRGAVFDTEAVLRGMDEGLVRDLIMDCWEGEPEIPIPLMERSFIATPHIAGFSADGKCNGSRTCVEHGLAFFGLHSSHIDEMQPPAPEDPIRELAHFLEEDRLEHLLLSIYDPKEVDRKLRAEPHRFSELRKNYPYPREPLAYTLRGKSTPEELERYTKLGFHHEGTLT
ncbi:MAG: 4-phosphoerythronate dehydrogenase [Porphyromonas sp.]|nr:4-phosphoerythronate dehydrogenase [Porphyromonas sp.]